MVISDEVEWRNGLLPSISHRMQRARKRDVVDVVSSGIGERTGLSPTRHTAIDQLRIALQADVRAETKPFHNAGTEPFDQRVRVFDQLQRSLDRFRFLQIERHRAAAAQINLHLGRLTPTLTVDADDFGAHIREQHPGEWAGADSREFHDTNAFERSHSCLLYTSDAADDLLCVDLGGRRIIKKKKKQHTI